jgi:Uma2 family endonuclease
MATTRPIADEELLRLPKDGCKHELVDGEIRAGPAGIRHEEVGLRLILRLAGFVLERRLGKVLGSSAGFRLPSGNVRSPDVSFVAARRFPGDTAPEGFAELAPDLAVEILSPEDRPREVLDKVGEYLQAGVRLVWVIDPKQSEASVYRSLTDTHVVGSGAILDGEDVLPGFRCPLVEILSLT